MVDQFSHWRNSQRAGRFFMFDARASAAFFIVLIHFRLWTIILALMITTIFWALEQRGLTFEAALRGLRSWLVGAKRPALVFNARRQLIDLGPGDIEPTEVKPPKPVKAKKGAPAAAPAPAPAKKPAPLTARLPGTEPPPIADDEGVDLPPRPATVKTVQKLEE